MTYEANAPRAVMHGFLNVFLAASFAWHGDHDIEPILAERDPAAFHFDDRLTGASATLPPSRLPRSPTEFAHAFGSCSFEEPVHDLQALGLL